MLLMSSKASTAEVCKSLFVNSEMNTVKVVFAVHLSLQFCFEFIFVLNVCLCFYQ